LIKVLNVRKSIEELKSEEFVIGSELTGSHACYMIYGVLRYKEKDRLIKPGKGHEEIVFILKGSVKVTGEYNGILYEGDAFHIVEEESCLLENISDSEVIYIIAGGHTEKGHKH